jgi:uncharacterized membrane protein
MVGLAPAVFFLCFLTSVCCSWLLVRSYRNTRTKLLLWSAVCFVLLALNNFFLVLDLVFLPHVDLSLIRGLLALAAVSTLLYGFIWELD